MPHYCQRHCYYIIIGYAFISPLLMIDIDADITAIIRHYAILRHIDDAIVAIDIIIYAISPH
jgi:hypothetical protein